ncbi:hypothetical protein [Caballeronia sp. Lep1P3]|uniref:hypothetical protein n=1 Tax=Caballeronia sp. Lep1P3 TaxID=2878150 RepID=UPI001FD159CA|nr:hypothetical protein [Caballeronia sp. Lep1P3]
MSTLQSRLKLFNAKERFALVSHILGNAHFEPAADFMRNIKELYGVSSAPYDIYGAMEYHLDWLYAALLNPEVGAPIPLVIGEDGGYGPVTGSQEDIDFLVCFSLDENSVDAVQPVTYLVLIEAKGVTNWETPQLASKLARFRTMKAAFEANPNVRTKLLLMSPTDPRLANRQNEALRQVIADFEDFGSIDWLPIPMEAAYQKVVRCDANGVPTKTAPTHWKVQLR